MSEEKKVTLTSIEDAWKLAKENGYEGTLEEFDVMCRNAAEQMESEKMDLDSMDAVAGGSASEVVENIVNWCDGHKEMLIGIASGVATLAAGFAIYKCSHSGKTKDPGYTIISIKEPGPFESFSTPCP